MKKRPFQLNLPRFTERLKMMKSNTLELASKETTRLLDVQSDALTKALAVKGFLNASVEEEIKKWIKNIENDRANLEKNQMVLGVIGTMKAGKSTTINAIVGMEILPNRETAMTTLPTLIRNKHGQVQPVLKIGLTHEIFRTECYPYSRYSSPLFSVLHGYYF